MSGGSRSECSADPGVHWGQELSSVGGPEAPEAWPLDALDLH